MVDVLRDDYEVMCGVDALHLITGYDSMHRSKQSKNEFKLSAQLEDATAICNGEEN